MLHEVAIMTMPITRGESEPPHRQWIRARRRCTTVLLVGSWAWVAMSGPKQTSSAHGKAIAGHYPLGQRPAPFLSTRRCGAFNELLRDDGARLEPPN